MTIQIEGNLIRGYLHPHYRAMISRDSIKECELGGFITENYPVPCQRCNSTRFHICIDDKGWACFCSTKSCLQEDSDESARHYREKKAKEMEKLYGRES